MQLSEKIKALMKGIDKLRYIKLQEIRFDWQFLLLPAAQESHGDLL